MSLPVYKFGGWWWCLMPRWVDGITFAPCIYFCASRIDVVPMWLQVHERVHIDQQKELGRFRFVFLYLVESVKHGYKNNKFEIEAYKISGRG